MVYRKIAFCWVAIVCAFSMSGCSKADRQPKLPALNDENCKHENLVKIPDKAARQEFASMCLRRNKFEPSPERTW